MATKQKWTEADMIDATMDYWWEYGYDARDCEVRRDDSTDPPTLIVLHRPSGRTSAEFSDAGRWNLDGTAYGD